MEGNGFLFSLSRHLPVNLSDPRGTPIRTVWSSVFRRSPVTTESRQPNPPILKSAICHLLSLPRDSRNPCGLTSETGKFSLNAEDAKANRRGAQKGFSAFLCENLRDLCVKSSLPLLVAPVPGCAALGSLCPNGVPEPHAV